MAYDEITPEALTPPAVPLREVTPIPTLELARLRREADTAARLDVVEVKVDVLAEGQDRIEKKLDDNFKTLLEAMVAQNAAAQEGNPLKNNAVQVVLAVALLIVIGAAVGKDFVLDTPAVDVTTTESP